MKTRNPLSPDRLWWHRRSRPLTLGEHIADGVVHGLGLLLAIAVGIVLLAFASGTAVDELPALAIYLLTLVTVLGVSLAFNLWPVSPVKKHLARLDQAAIFLFIAGTYTPFLALIGGTRAGDLLAIVVWGLALVGVALKLVVPQRFGRLAILLYLAIGWSGVFAFSTLAAILPASTLWLLLSGGIVYSAGIVFHLWEKLKFQTALWHGFVVVGASLHLFAVLDVMVLKRL